MPTIFNIKTGKFEEIDDKKKHALNLENSTILIKGDKGDKGDPGESIKGEPGKSIKGDKGEPGKDGRDGIAKDGRDGKDGANGRGIASIKQPLPEKAEIIYTDGTSQSIILPAGKDGREVELGDSATHIRWRYKNEAKWNDLIPIPKAKMFGGGAHYFKDLADVAIKGIANGQVPIWNAAAKKFVPGTGGVSNHNDLSGLQGGTTNEYYHLTSAQNALVAVMTAAEIDDGNSGTSQTIDFSAGAYHKSTLTGSVTYTFTAPPAPCIIQLKVVQGSGPYSITWPTIKWPGGSAPGLSQAPGAVDIFTFYYDGTSYWQKGVQFALA